MSTKSMSKSSQFIEFFHELLPQLTKEDLETIDKLYPDSAIHSDSPYKEDRVPQVGEQYKRIEAAYGHYAYVAPVLQTAHFASAGSRNQSISTTGH
jgi:hypothetical protein